MNFTQSQNLQPGFLTRKLLLIVLKYIYDAKVAIHRLTYSSRIIVPFDVSKFLDSSMNVNCIPHVTLMC